MQNPILLGKEEKILRSIRVASDNDPRHPEFPPNNPKFPATPTQKIEVPGFKEVLLKDESVNPTGTHKDRMAWEIITFYREFLKSKEMGLVVGDLPRFSIISSGNAALSLSYFLKKYSLPKPKILIDINLSEKLMQSLKKLYVEIYQTDLSRKALSSAEILALTDNNEGIDITSNEALDPNIRFYDWMSFETINNNPDYILVPFGTGSLYENLCNIIKQEVQKVGSHDPRFKADPTIIRKCNIIGTTVNLATTKADKLYSPHLPFVHYDEHWLKFYKKFGFIGPSSGVFIVSEQSLESAHELATSQGIECEHSGIAGLAYLLQNEYKLPKDKRYLVVNTGKGKF